MSLIKQVYGSFRWKQNDETCANRLGISLDKYRAIKQQISEVKNSIQDEVDDTISNIIAQRVLGLAEEQYSVSSDLEDRLTAAVNEQREKVIEFEGNLEEGTAKIKGIAFKECKSPEEIIETLKIDTTKWKLSHYWNKQQGDHWLVSAFVTQIRKESKDYLAETIKNFTPQYLPLAEVHINETYDRPTVGVLSVQDLHFGKEGNDGIDLKFRETVSSLVMRAYHSHKLDKLVFVFGGDLLNMDTFFGATTKGTPVDNDQRAQDAYNHAFDAMYWAINFAAQFCNHLDVVYIPGNHDRLSSYHLAHALSKCFKDPRVKFYVDYAERKVITYGENFFAFEHGDAPSKNTPLVYATEYPKEWGSTTYRTCYTGHWHKKKSTEYVTEDEVNGFTLKHLPSLCKSDYWHYHNKYVGSKRAGVLELHDYNCGKVCELTHVI
jgi:hypothetical protein